MEKKSMLKAIKKAIALLLTICLVTPALAGSFAPDVADDDSHILAIRTMEAEGIMGKNADGTYNPTGTVARGELASMLCKLLDGSKALTAGDSGFYDVPTDHAANAAVRELAEQGIVLGYGDGRYGPEDAVTYEQLTAMLARALVGEDRIQERGAYPFGHLNVGQDFGLQTNVSGQTGVALSRADVAQMVYNCYYVQALQEQDPAIMVSKVLRWLGWDRDTLRSYLASKLTYTLIHEGYDYSAIENGRKNIDETILEDAELDMTNDGSLSMTVYLDRFIPGFDGVLELPIDLYVGEQPSRSESEIKQWLCQGTQDDPWYGADTVPSYYGAQFNGDGTCTVEAGILWSGVGDIVRGTYTVSGDRLIIQITERSDAGETQTGDFYDNGWVPYQTTWEYRVLSTKTGLAFVQTSETGLGMESSVGKVLTWQKGYPIDLNKSAKVQTSTTGTAAGKPETTPASGFGGKSVKELCKIIADHYNAVLKPDGNYDCFESETELQGDVYTFVLRYQISNEEAERTLADGGIPSSNIYTAEIYVDRTTGVVTDEWGWEVGPWKITD